MATENLSLSDPRVAAELKANPDGYHKAVLDRAKEINKTVAIDMITRSNKFITSYAQGMQISMNLLSEELMIFRRIETRVRSGTGTEEIMNSLFNELNEFRERARKLGEQMAANNRDTTLGPQ